MKAFFVFCIALSFVTCTTARSQTLRDHRFNLNGDLSQASITQNLGQLSDQNGRTMPEVKFYTQDQGRKVYFTDHSMHFVFSRSEKRTSSNTFSPASFKGIDTSGSLTLYRTDVHFLGSLDPIIEGEDRTEDYTNYYLTSCPNGLTHVPSFKKIRYHELYHAIDLEVVFANDRMKYEFIVHPGGDPSQIKMQYDDRELLQIAQDGSLLVANDFGQMRDDKPVSYQVSQSISTSFVVNDQIVSYDVGAYDASQDLVIDPPRLWSTYYGGANGDICLAVATDPSGNIYATGSTNSPTGIATTGAFDAVLNITMYGDGFIVKFNSSGVRQWGTYFGGGGAEAGAAIAIDHNGDFVVAGTTTSSAGIATPGEYQSAWGFNNDAFVIKFDASGARIWGTYYGTAQDFGLAVAVDASNNVFLGGLTGPNALGACFVAKFNSAGTTLAWQTIWGGTSGVASDFVSGLAVSSAGDVYAGGGTYTTSSFATTGAHQTVHGGNEDAFVAKLSSAGVISWCSYYGGAVYEDVLSLALDANANIYITGRTNSTSAIATAGAYQTTNGGGGDAYLAKWSSSGVLLWGTYFGGSGADQSYAVTLDQNQNPIFGGITANNSGIATPGEFQTTYPGAASYAMYFAKFNGSGARQWCTYYGTGHSEWLYGLAVDSSNNLIVVGVTDDPDSGMSTVGAHQRTNGNTNGSDDGFIAKFCGIARPAITSSSGDTICQGTSRTLTAPSGFTTYQWREGGTDISGATSSTYVLPTTLTAGLYKYTVAVTTPTCNTRSDTAFVLIHGLPTAVAGPNQTICSGDSAQIGGPATGGTPPYTYSWSPATGLTSVTLASPKAHPITATTYTVVVTDSNGCQNSASAIISVNPTPALALTRNVETCRGTPIQIGSVATGGTAPITYLWTPTTGLSSSTAAQPMANPTTSGTKYFVTATDANSCHVKDRLGTWSRPGVMSIRGVQIGLQR